MLSSSAVSGNVTWPQRISHIPLLEITQERWLIYLLHSVTSERPTKGKVHKKLIFVDTKEKNCTGHEWKSLDIYRVALTLSVDGRFADILCLFY